MLDSSKNNTMNEATLCMGWRALNDELLESCYILNFIARRNDSQWHFDLDEMKKKDD